MRRFFLAAFGAASLAACTTVHTNGTPDPNASSGRSASDTVFPGDARLEGRRIMSTAATYHWIVEQKGESKPFGEIRDVTSTTILDGRTLLLRVATVVRGTMTLTDSTWSDPSTLAAVQHRSVQPLRRLAVNWSGAVIQGRIILPGGKPPIVKDSAFTVPSFDSSNWELLIRAMDLAQGRTRIFPVYDVDGGLQWYRATVQRRTLMNGRDAFVIAAALGSAGTATVTVDAKSREVLLIEIPMGAAATLRQVPVAPGV
jgi:hypothetical protein